MLVLSLLVTMVTSQQNYESVFQNPEIIRQQNDPNMDLVSNEFLALFNLDCLRYMEDLNRNIIGEFLTEFPCYSINPEKDDKFPEIGDYMIVINKNTNNNNETCNDDKQIIWTDFCLSAVEQNQRFELFQSTSSSGPDCKSRTLGYTSTFISKFLWSLNQSCPDVTDGLNYLRFLDESYDPEFDIIVMDSGIDSTHYEFRLWNITRIYDSEDGADLTSAHGTAVASVIIGYTVGVMGGFNPSPNIKLYDIRISNWTSSNILNGFNAILQQLIESDRKAIINFSWGQQGSGSTILTNRISTIKSLGGIIFNAAGNGDTRASGYWPPSLDTVITVGAHDINNDKTSISNFGDDVNIWAPGQTIYCADYSGYKTYMTSSGTSFASPFVAGIAANILANNPDFEFDDILDRLYEYSIFDLDDSYGDNLEPRVQISCNEYSSTISPTNVPTKSPTQSTDLPTTIPTPSPTKHTKSPTASPSQQPTQPTIAPTDICYLDVSGDCNSDSSTSSWKMYCDDDGNRITERWIGFGNTDCSGDYTTTTTTQDLDCCPISSFF